MRWVNVLVIFATFFAYLSPFINPSRFWQFSFFGLIYPWLLLSNIIMAVFWIFRKKKYFFLSLGCIILGWGHLTSFVGFNFSENTQTESSIIIGSYNVKNLERVRIGRKGSEERIKFIKERFNFPFVHSFNPSGTFVFSKYPIVNSGGVNFGLLTNSCSWADLIINEKKVRVYSIHLQ